MPDIIPGYRGSTITTSAGKSFINTVIAKLPFSYQIIENITALNPKYTIFQDLVADKETRLQSQSIFKNQVEDELGLGSLLVDKNFQKYMYANLDLDKVKRLQDYRLMSTYSTLADCLDEICDEIFVEDHNKKIANLTVSEEFSTTVKAEIEKEWDKFFANFKFEDKGWSYTRQFLIDGELFWENVISENHPEYGILGVVSIPTELINPFYKNAQNDIIDGFSLRKPVINPRTQKMDKEELIIFNNKQVTYINSGMWNSDRTMRLPVIENARRAYKQLSLIEDSIVIYRLVRAPERLAFHIDVGNMSPPKAEGYMKRLMQQYWAKKTYDTTTGRVTNVYDPQSMLDSYWFPKRAGTEGSKVEMLQGGANLGKLEDLDYFLRLLYKSMKVPVGRLNSDDQANTNDSTTTREELRFAKFLIRIQRQFAQGVKESFITHLKLRKLWEKYKIKEGNLKVIFNVPTMFMELKQQQMFDLKYNNFNNLSNNEGISNSYAQKYFLGLTDEQMAVNREWQRKDAAMRWELEQILTGGPNWKQNVQAMQQATAEMAGGGGGGGAAPMAGEAPAAGEENPPEFGAAPAGAEGAAGAPAGGGAAPAPAPAPAGAPPAAAGAPAGA